MALRASAFGLRGPWSGRGLDTQLAKLKAEGCEVIRSEKLSGASRNGRDELATVLDFLRPGDELVVTRLDRLGRDTRDVLNLIYECEQKGAFVTVLDAHVSTRGEMGHIVLTVLGMVAQMERRFIKERQRDGVEQAKAKGTYKGGKRRIDYEQILTLRNETKVRVLPLSQGSLDARECARLVAYNFAPTPGDLRTLGLDHVAV